MHLSHGDSPVRMQPRGTAKDITRKIIVPTPDEKIRNPAAEAPECVWQNIST